MSTNQHFSLRWNDYLQHITKAFDSLRSDDNFVDVTLSCEGKRIHAHKMLLSACSTYFRDILKENPCQHPIIILKNVKYDDLQALIDFMYQGEVSVVQEQLTSFLTTAELLAVQGLTNGSVDDHQIRSHGVTLQKKPAKPQQFVVTQTLRATSPSNRIKKRKLSKIHIDKEKSLRKETSEASDVSYVPIVMPSVKVEIPEYFEQSATNNISVGFDDSDIGENCEYIEESHDNDVKNTSDENVCTVYSPDQTDAGTQEEIENPSTSEGIQQDSSLQDWTGTAGTETSLHYLSEMCQTTSEDAVEEDDTREQELMDAIASADPHHQIIIKSVHDTSGLSPIPSPIAAQEIEVVTTKLEYYKSDASGVYKLEPGSAVSTQTGTAWQTTRGPKASLDKSRYQCDICDQSFAHKGSLDHHKSFHTGNTTCPICLRVFSRKYTMKKHMEYMHNQANNTF